MELPEPIPDENRKVAVFATGRMNPPTRGHKHLVDFLKKTAQEHQGDAFLLPTRTYDGFGSTYKSNGVEKVRTKVSADKIKNPLRHDIKLQYIKKLLGQPGVVIDSDVNALSALFRLKELGYTDLIYVAGGDYFDGDVGDTRFINEVLPTKADELGLGYATVNAGLRVSGCPGVSGYKASYAREAARNDDIGEFRAKTGWRGEVAYDLMQDVRKGMGLA